MTREGHLGRASGAVSVGGLSTGPICQTVLGGSGHQVYRLGKITSRDAVRLAVHRVPMGCAAMLHGVKEAGATGHDPPEKRDGLVADDVGLRVGRGLVWGW